MRTRFRVRNEAGKLLAEKLSAYANKLNVVVLALPRGGVPVGAQVARKLNAAFDVFVVRKLEDGVLLQGPCPDYAFLR